MLTSTQSASQVPAKAPGLPSLSQDQLMQYLLALQNAADALDQARALAPSSYLDHGRDRIGQLMLQGSYLLHSDPSA